MSYFDLMLESEDQVMINKVIENATFQMCIEGGEAVIQDVEDYVDLLMTENYEPTPQFDEYMFESLSPYLEENAKYLGMFLFEGTPEENQKIIKATKSDAEQAKFDQTKANSNKVRFNKKLGLMQKVKNTFSKDKTAKGLGQSMMKGLQNAKRSLGNKMLKAGTAQAATAGSRAGGIAPTKAVMKGGLLGKVASVGKNMVRSSNLANANALRTNIGKDKKIPTTKKV